MDEGELELTPGEMRRMVDRAMDRIVEHVRTLPEQPAADVEGGVELARQQVEGLPEEGTPFDELLDLLFDRLVPKTFNTASPGYLAYIPGGGLFHSAVADLIADATNRYVGVWRAAPALVQIEANVVRWFCDILGYPERAGGFLTTGGSLANLTAVVTARRERLGDRFLDGTIYVSDQTHHSVAKAAVLAGFPADRVRRVPSDEEFRIRVQALRDAVARDRESGLRPFLVVGNAGTTNTGAVDDLAALAEVTGDDMWLHVDAAYGGFFRLTERGRRVMAGIERSDSATIDPHKGLFLPYGTGALVVRDRDTLRRTHQLRADYMPDRPPSTDLVDFSEVSPELSRDFRGLRVWLPLKMHGIGVFRRYLDEKLDLTERVTERLRELPAMEIVAEPQLSLVAFRWVPEDLAGDPEALDRLNRELMERVNERRRVFLTGTRLRGRFAIRVCVLSFRTHRGRIEACLEDLEAALEEMRADRDPVEA